MTQQEPRQKGRVGPYEVWLVGKMAWEVRMQDKTLATARNCSDCWRAAERLNEIHKKETKQ